MGVSSCPFPSSSCPGHPLSMQSRLRQHRLEHGPVWGGKAAVLCSVWKSLSHRCLQPIQSQLFSRLLKISLGLASSVSSAASRSHLPPSPMSRGTLTSKEVHQYAPWGLGRKTWCTWMGLSQSVPASATKTKARKGGVCCSTWGHLYNTKEPGSRAVHSQQPCTPWWVKHEGGG